MSDYSINKVKIKAMKSILPIDSKSKKRTNSKSVGNIYERVIAKKLSKWLTGSDKEIVCWRTAGSGSVGTNRKKKGLSGKNIDSDFQCLDLRFKNFFDTFYLDSKSLTKINLFMINEKNQKSNKLLNEWKKVVDNAKSSNKIPLMFVKIRDDKRISDFIVSLIDYSNICCFNYIEYYFEYNVNYNCTICTQEEFFKLNSWSELVENNKYIIENF